MHRQQQLLAGKRPGKHLFYSEPARCLSRPWETAPEASRQDEDPGSIRRLQQRLHLGCTCHRRVARCLKRFIDVTNVILEGGLGDSLRLYKCSMRRHEVKRFEVLAHISGKKFGRRDGHTGYRSDRLGGQRSCAAEALNKL